MKRLALGHIGVLLLFALSGLDCDGPPDTAPPTVVPVSTVYPPISVAPVTTQTPIRADVESIPWPSWPALVGPDTPCQEWLPTALAVGWPQDRDINEKLMSIMWRESRCLPDALNKDDPNGGSVGLLQINLFWCKPSSYTDTGWLQDMGILSSCLELYDPVTNLRAGVAIYEYSLDKNGTGWHPWRT